MEHYRSSIFKEKREISGNLYEAVQVPEDVYKDALAKVKDSRPGLNEGQLATVAKGKFALYYSNIIYIYIYIWLLWIFLAMYYVCVYVFWR